MVQVAHKQVNLGCAPQEEQPEHHSLPIDATLCGIRTIAGQGVGQLTVATRPVYRPDHE